MIGWQSCRLLTAGVSAGGNTEPLSITMTLGPLRTRTQLNSDSYSE